METKLAKLESELNLTNYKLASVKLILENVAGAGAVHQFFLLIMGMIIFCKYNNKLLMIPEIVCMTQICFPVSNKQMF